MHPEHNHDSLIRTLAFSLRHGPDRFDLDLDEEGWTSLDDLAIALRFHCPGLGRLNGDSIRSAIAGMDRFEVRGERIRAVYGHTVALGTPPPITVPPHFLFHGTSVLAMEKIMVNGLSPMSRRFVHLTSDREYAAKVAVSKSDQPVLATVRALDAHRAGCVFRKANEQVWLASTIEPRHIEFDPQTPLQTMAMSAAP